MLASLLKHFDYRLFLPLIARFPYGTAYRLAALRGDCLYWTRGEQRRHSVASIRMAFPTLSEPEARQVARRHYRELSVDEMESFWFQDAGFFREQVAVEGIDELRSAAARPGGAILLLGHWASACTLFAAVGSRGVPFHIVGRPLEREADPMHPAHLRYGLKRVAALEKAVGNPFIYTGRGNFQRLAELLRSRQIVMLMFDVTPNILRHVQSVEFFGRRAFFGDGVVALQEQTGSRIFWGSIQRSPRSPYQRVHIKEAPAPGTADGNQLLQHLVSMLQAEIERRPFQWTLWDSMSWFYQKPGRRDETG